MVRMKKEDRSTLNTHHLCWPRKKWDRGYAKLIRSHWYFNVQIPANTLHASIHKKMWGIPTPDGTAAKDAYEQIRMLEESNALHRDDSVELRLNLLIALFECIAQPTADAFKEQKCLINKFNEKAPH